MSPKNQETRKVRVLTPFRDREGKEREKDEVFSAAYANDRQRQAVNEMIHRGFLVFDTEQQVEPRRPNVPATRAKRGGSRG